MDRELLEPARDSAGLAALSDEDWISALDDIGEERGYFEPLGKDHAAIFSDRGTSLLVTFETLASVRARTTQLPLGFALAERPGWSQLTLLATGSEPKWFRDRRVYGYFDRLVDDGFFEDFDRVVFYGAGMCGYAAAAFSAAAPGATVIVVAPQATLTPDLAGWDRRFLSARRLSFTDRYGYAPKMIDAAAACYVCYDPAVRLDAAHAGHFVADHVVRLKLRRSGPNPEALLSRQRLLPRLIAAAMENRLDPASFHKLWRVRRNDLPWLRAVLGDLEKRGNAWRFAKAARSIAARTGNPRFRAIAERASGRLEAEGRSLPARRGQALPAAE